MNPSDEIDDGSPSDNVDENADAAGDAGDIDELAVPEGADD
jgi:hypothetical protein